MSCHLHTQKMGFRRAPVAAMDWYKKIKKVFTCQCPTLQICLFRFRPLSHHVVCPFYRRHLWIILGQRGSWRRSANEAQRQQPWSGSSCLRTPRENLMRIQLLLHAAYISCHPLILYFHSIHLCLATTESTSTFPWATVTDVSAYSFLQIRIFSRCPVQTKLRKQ